MYSQIVCGKVIGIPINPNVSDAAIEEIVARFSSGPRINFAVLDLAPTAQIMQLIRGMVERGHKMKFFCDHHKGTIGPDENNIVPELRYRLLAQHGFFSFIERAVASSCTELASFDIARNRKITVVFFDDDLDGLFSFLRLCGATWPQIITDAQFLERSSRDISTKFSQVGKLARDMQFLFRNLPYGQMIRARTEAWQQFVDFVVGGCNWDDFRDFVEQVRRPAEQARIVAGQAFARTTVQDGIAFLDCFGTPYDEREWKRRVLETNGSVLLVRKQRRLGSYCPQETYLIELPPEWEGRFDLRTFLSNGHAGQSYKVRISAHCYESFLAQWRERKID